MKNMSREFGRCRAWQRSIALAVFLCCAFLLGTKSYAAREEMVIQVDLVESTSGARLPAAPQAKLKRIAADDAWSYKSQLQGRELEIYRALEAQGRDGLLEHSQNKKIEVDFQEPYRFNVAQGQDWQQTPDAKTMAGEWAKAVGAFVKDYNEYYWLSGSTQFSIYGRFSTNPIEISGLGIWIEDYYVEHPEHTEECYKNGQLICEKEFSAAGIREEIPATDRELQTLIDRIEGDSRYEIVKNAHDAVAKLVTYATGDLNAGRYHTITGGLLEKYNHFGVCECYAKLLRLICQEKGIPCILVMGGSREENGLVVADHMWNYVQMEDKQWYLVDATWDDQGSKILDACLLVGADSPGMKCAKVSEDHIPVGMFSANQTYTPFTLPTLSARSYRENHPGSLEKLTFPLPSRSLKCGEKITLSVQLAPENAGNYQLQWSTSNKSVATVQGRDQTADVTATGAGQAKITVKDIAQSKVEASCTVIVSHVDPSAYSVERQEPTTEKEGYIRKICPGCGAVVEEEILPKKEAQTETSGGTGSGSTGSGSTGSGSGAGSSGTGSGSGGTSAGGQPQKQPAQPQSGAEKPTVQPFVQLNVSSLPLQIKKSTKVLKVTSMLAGDRVVSWKSSNKKVVTVNSSGKLTAKKKGSAVITVTTARGATAQCKVTVQKGRVKTKKLAVSRKEVILKKGQSFKLTVSRTPLTATDKITYKSSKKKVATVSSSGKIKAKKKGKATITVSAGGKKAKINVIVN